MKDSAHHKIIAAMAYFKTQHLIYDLRTLSRYRKNTKKTVEKKRTGKYELVERDESVKYRLAGETF